MSKIITRRLLSKSKSVGIWSVFVRHGQLPSMVKSNARIHLVPEVFAPDAVAAFPRSRRVAALGHEARDDSMKSRAVVVAFQR